MPGRSPAASLRSVGSALLPMWALVHSAPAEARASMAGMSVAPASSVRSHLGSVDHWRRARGAVRIARTSRRELRSWSPRAPSEPARGPRRPVPSTSGPVPRPSWRCTGRRSTEPAQEMSRCDLRGLIYAGVQAYPLGASDDDMHGAAGVAGNAVGNMGVAAWRLPGGYRQKYRYPMTSRPSARTVCRCGLVPLRQHLKPARRLYCRSRNPGFSKPDSPLAS
jgi:hypothetical protein